MSDRRLDRLMNQELDGANGPAEREALRQALDADADARGRFEEMRAAHELLRGLEAPAPGPEFKRGVLSALRTTAHPASPARSPRLAFFPGALRLKYTLFFGLGLGLGLLILVVFKGRTSLTGLESRQLMGTVAESRVLRPAGEVKFEQGAVRQEIRLSYGDGCLVVDVRGAAGSGLDTVLTFDRERLSFDALRRTAGDEGGVTIAPGRFGVHVSGTHGYVLVFAAMGGLPLSLRYRVEEGGAEVFAKDLRLTPEDIR
jgi:hypothetical protein